MADINQFPRAGVIHKLWNPQTIDSSIDVMWMRRNQFAGVLGKYVEVVPISQGLTHVISSLGSALPLPEPNEDLEPYPVVQSAPGFKKTATVVNYTSSLQVTETAISTDRTGKLMQTLNGPIKAAMRFDEYMRAAFFANAFTGTAGADSQPLCSNSHPHENFDAGTWDNLSTGGLTGPNLHAGILVMDLMKDEQNDPFDVNPVDLLVHPSNRQKAMELTNAVRKPEGMLNDPNEIISALNVVVSKYLSSSDAFFVMGDLKGEERGLIEVQSKAWSLDNVGDATVDVPIHKRIKSRKTFIFTTSKNIVGSAG